MGNTLFVQFLVLLSDNSLFAVILACNFAFCLFVIIRYVFWYTCLHAVVDNNL